MVVYLKDFKIRHYYSRPGHDGRFECVWTANNTNWIMAVVMGDEGEPVLWKEEIDDHKLEYTWETPSWENMG